MQQQPSFQEVTGTADPFLVSETAPQVEIVLEEEDSDSEETLDEEDYYETKVEVQQNPTSVPTSVRTIETKIDTPAWAPIAPYLSYHEQDSRDELYKNVSSRKTDSQ